MKKSSLFSVRGHLRSFKYAGNGLLYFFRNEPNAILHLLATIVVIALVCVLHVSSTEIAVLAITIGMVWVAEVFNTAIEKIMDFISPAIDPKVKIVKDLSAAAVLVSAIAALVVGCIIFIPKL